MGSTSYPIVLTKLHRAPCLVVGGGTVAERKIAALLEAGAQVTVISPTVTPQIQHWADDGRFRMLERVWEADDISGCALVIAATNDRQVNATVACIAHATGVLVNVVDDPAAGSFVTPSTIRRGDLLVSVTTGGQSPSVAALVRRTLERALGDEYTMLLELLGNLRFDVRDELPSSARTGQHDRVSAFVTQQLMLAHTEQPNGEGLPTREQDNR